MKVRSKKIICNALIVLLIAVVIVCFSSALLGVGDFANWLCWAALVCLFVVPLDFWREKLKRM